MTDQASRDSGLLEGDPEPEERDQDQEEPHQGAGEDDHQLEGRDQVKWQGGVWPEDRMVTSWSDCHDSDQTVRSKKCLNVSLDAQT